MGDWQDIVVTVVAAVGAFIVFWRTFGSWKDSKPGSAGSPHCEGCALADAVHQPERAAGSESKDPVS